MSKWWRDLSPGLRAAIVGALAFAFYTGCLLLIFRDSLDSALVSGLFYALIFAGGTYFTRNASVEPRRGSKSMVSR
ncbi:hypothetical protein ACFVYC_13570 [Pseudarthrobacter sp. NPDC058329]|uniref:hypothetical protein n=1 Tax=Pseudarthrobacter sp. NPDC058329 TaxID=3346448 RepID=UPI0036DDF3EE